MDCWPSGADRPLAGYAGDKPTYEGVSAMNGKDLKDVLKAYKSYKKGKITFNEFLDEFSDNCADGYIECHYHDKLGIEDVESITTTKGKLLAVFGDMSEERRKRVLTKLKNNGILLQVGHKRGEKKGLEDGYEILRKEYGLE